MRYLIEFLGLLVICIALVLVGICGVYACVVGIKQIRKELNDGNKN